ncbi:MAG: DUF2442 domain-containing protein [Anaeromyxobacteraceae bacterium]
MVRVRGVTPLEGMEVEIAFTDGSVRRVDLAPLLRGPVFQPVIDDPALFRAVQVDPIGKTLTWPNGADLDPDVLYLGLRPAE